MREWRETTIKWVISFNQTQLEKENKVLKEKVEKLPKDLANFVDGTKNLDKLIGVQRSFYYRIGISFNMNPNKVFQRPNKYKIAKIKCSNCNKWRHKPHNVTERGTFLSERWLSLKDPRCYE